MFNLDKKVIEISKDVKFNETSTFKLRANINQLVEISQCFDGKM